MNIPGFTAEASLASGRREWVAASPDLAGGRQIFAQVQDDDTIWTKDKICEACGCTVKGFICDCGLRPRPETLECIKNGGPGRTRFASTRLFLA